MDQVINPSYLSFSECGSVISDRAGTITNPGYPNSYSNNRDCVWVIEAPQDTIIRFKVTDLDIERSPKCAYDFVSIYDGSDINAKQLGVYCGDTPASGVFRTSGNRLTVRFKSDSSGTRKGFKIRYDTVKKPSVEGLYK